MLIKLYMYSKQNSIRYLTYLNMHMYFSFLTQRLRRYNSNSNACVYMLYKLYILISLSINVLNVLNVPTSYWYTVST